MSSATGRANFRGQTLPVILNPAAGSDPKAKVDEIEQRVRSAGIVPDIRVVSPGNLAAEVRRCVERGCSAIGIGGGDGTISTAVDALVDTKVTLIPFPLGTLNHFATRYGLGTLDATTLALTEGSIIPIPVGRVGERTFVNNASCGYYPHVVRHRERLRPVFSKWPAAVFASLMVALKRPLLELELIVHGEKIERKTAALWIGIGRYSLRLPEPGDAEKEGAILELVLPRPHSRLRLFVLAVRILAKLKRSQKAIDAQLEVLRVSEFGMRSLRPIDVALDGEVHVMSGPLRFRYHAEALQVLSMVEPEST